MQFWRILSVFTALLGVAGLACGGSVEHSTAGGNGGAGGGGASNGGAGGSGTGGGTGGGTEAFCAEACDDRAADTCYTIEACSMYCSANAGAWPKEVADAFAACAAENPLCFESMEGCILSQLHPSGSPRQVRLAGKGFDAYNGKVLFAWHDPDAGSPFGGEAIITGGAFMFEWVEPLSTFDTNGPLMLLYIDMDGDKMCNAAADLTASESGAWNGDFIKPIYEILLSPPLSDPDFVCSSLP